MVDSLLSNAGMDIQQIEAWGLDRVFIGIPVWRWLGAALTLVLGWIVLGLVLQVLRRKTTIDDSSHLPVRLLHGLAASTGHWFVAILVISASLNWLSLRDSWTHVLGWVFTAAVWLQFGLWASRVFRTLLEQGLRKHLEENPAQATSINVVRYLGQLVLWSAVLLLALENLGVDISALVAGFGIGGVAVALAAQSVLGDLFASLAIVFDRPFVVGDFIVVGDLMGEVKKVGLKTTRIRSLGGEELIFTNTDLLGSRVKNYKRMQERRVVFHFGVLYQTAADKLREVKRLTRETIEATEHARFDRAHFQAFGDSSLVFEAVYYVDSNDYNIYMDVQEAINLRLFEAFEELGVDFAYPTRTLHLASGMDSLRSSLVEREASGEASTEEPGNGRDPDSSGEESREPASSNERGQRGE